MFTNMELAAFCQAVYAAKWVYWYGTCGYKATSSLYNSKKKQYPAHYTAAREKGYRADISDGKMCADCVGLIKAFFWLGGDLGGKSRYGANGCPDKSANGMYALCKEHGPISTLPDVPGMIVWKSGHIGVYVGDGYTVEMQGFAADCVKRKVSKGTWTHWGKLPASMLSYDGAAVTPDTPPTRYALGERTLRKGCEGDDVTALQTALVALGFDCGAFGPAKNGVDGEYGAKTAQAVKALQITAGIDADGEYGPKSHAALMAMQGGAMAADTYTVTIFGVDAATATYLLETYKGATAVKAG